MIPALVVGAVTGLALFVLVYALIPRRVGLARRIAAFDAGRPPALRPARYPGDGNESALSKRLGAALALFGLIFPPIVLAGIGFAGVHLSVIVPVWAGLVFAAIFFFLPDIELRQQVEKRQRDFRHAISAFLDLVAMNLSGGRGVPEALMAASEIGEGWAFWRIRDALANARITGQTPWQALGVLGEEVQVSELKDLSAALSLVAEAFLVFLMYPAVHLLLQA